MSKNEIAKVEEKSTDLALPAELAGLFSVKDNMQGIVPRLPQIGIIHQGQLFKMPDESKVAEFTAIMLHKSLANAWWAESFDQSGGGSPPQCSSLDGVTPDFNSEDVQAERCISCPKNKFKSDGKRGKLCKNMMRVHVLLDGGDITPHRLTLSPTNLRAMSDYITGLSLKGLPFQLVFTKFSLKAIQNKDGIESSEVVLEKVGTITDPDIAQGIKKTVTQWMPAFTQTIGGDEF